MVDSNVTLSSQQGDQKDGNLVFSVISSEEAKKNVEFLKTQSESWLAVLFNIFGSVDRDDRAMIGDVISAWISITGDQASLDTSLFTVHLLWAQGFRNRTSRKCTTKLLIFSREVSQRLHR
jgi:hypothetical protein